MINVSFISYALYPLMFDKSASSQQYKLAPGRFVFVRNMPKMQLW